MDVLVLLQNLVANIAALQVQLQDAEAALVAEKLNSYNEGFAAGVASVPVGDPEKKYSEAELQAIVQSEVALALTMQKQAIKEAYNAQQALETKTEVDFDALISPPVPVE